MCRLMHRFWTAQEFAFFQLEGLFTVACGNIKQEYAGVQYQPPHLCSLCSTGLAMSFLYKTRPLFSAVMCVDSFAKNALCL